MNQLKGIKPHGMTMIVFVFIALVYLLTLTEYHAEGEDAVMYMLAVESFPMSAQAHPNHLLFGFLNRAHFLGWQALGYPGSSELPMQLISVLCGMVSLWLLYKIMRVMGVARLYALLLVLFLAGTHSFWFYSVEAENYVVALPGLLWVIAIMQRVRLNLARWWDYLTMGVALFWAVGMNQQLILLAPVIAVFCLMPVKSDSVNADKNTENSDVSCSQTRTSCLRHRVIGLTMTTLLSAALIGGVYVYCAVFLDEQSSVTGVINWSLGHGQSGTWEPLSWSNPIRGGIGLSRTLVCANVVFVAPYTEELILKVLPAHLVIEEAFLVRHLPGWFALLLVLCAGVVVALSAIYLGYALIRAASALVRRQLPGIAGLLFIILLLLALFSTIWSPSSNEFWIACVPIIVLLVAQLLAVRSEGDSQWLMFMRRGLFILVALTWMVNFMGGALWWRERENDYWFRVNQPLIENTREGDLIIHDAGWMNDNYLRFYADAEVIRPRRYENTEQATAKIMQTPGEVYISMWAIDPPRFILVTSVIHDSDHGKWQAYFGTMMPVLIEWDHTLKNHKPYDQRIYKLKEKPLVNH